MKKLHKSLVAFLSVSMLFTQLAACNTQKDEPKKNADGVVEDTEQTEFNITSGVSALSKGYSNNEVLKAMQEEVGIKITWEELGDALGEQVGIKIAGADLPDAFQGVGFSNYDLSKYGKDGTFIDLTPYITPEIMPNLSKILEERPEIKSAITMDDGKIYGLPSGEQMGTAGIGESEDYSIFSVPQFSMINKAWLDDLGLDVPETLDELHDALKAFKENDMSAKFYGNEKGSTIPLSTGFDQWCWGQNVFYAGFGFTNWTNDVMDDIKVRDGKVEFVSAQDYYRDAMTYFHDWVAEGLMDPEMFSQNDTQLMAKTQQGYVGVSTWWYIEELMGEYAKDYVHLPILTGPNGEKDVTLRTGGGTNSGNLSITRAAKSPINLLKFYDLWYKPENTMQLMYGPKGVFFTEQDENGVWMSITDAEAQEKYGKSAGEVKGEHEVNGPKLILSDYYGKYFHMEDRAVDRLKDLYEYWMPQVYNKDFYPIDAVFSQEELDIIDEYKQYYVDHAQEQEAKWLRDGAPTDEEWEAYKQTLVDSCGMNELLKVYQDAYDRYVEAGK